MFIADITATISERVKEAGYNHLNWEMRVKNVKKKIRYISVTRRTGSF